MNRNNFWPADDNYFGNGVMGIIDSLNSSFLQHDKQNYFFIKLTGSLLLNFMSLFPLLGKSDKKIIIISNPQLMPLALFYYQEFENVIAVFEKNTPVNSIINQLQKEQTNRSMGRKLEVLDRNDVFLLKCFLNGCSLKLVQELYKRQPSTIFGWKKKLACKLNVRKLGHLLLN